MNRVALRPWLALAGVLTLVLTACGANSDPLAGGSSSASASPSGGGQPVVVGSADFTESQVLGELYAQALSAKGVPATTKPNIGSREVYLNALKDGSVSIVPEYSGNLLLYFDKNSPAATEPEIEKALPAAVGDELRVLPASSATDQDVYVVTKDYSRKFGITSLGDLKKIASGATLGGPSELKDRSYGPPGLEGIYDATFKAFKPYSSPAVKVKDLNDNKIQVATFFTTEAAIKDNGYVQLSDPQQMILPQNIVPLVRKDLAGNQKATDALAGVQKALTTEELTDLNQQVDVKHQSVADVAKAWLSEKGLA